MASTAVIGLSRNGAARARRLAEGMEPEAVLYLEQRYAEPIKDGGSPITHTFELPVRTVLREVWDCYDAVVLFLPVGAAVRLTAPLLRDKRSDPGGCLR